MSDKLQKFLEHADKMAKELEASANRKDRQSEPVCAMLFRQEAYMLRNGKTN
jgi:hypothetical protein